MSLQKTAHSVDTLPMVLCLNAGGEALEWVSFKTYALYKINEKILWSLSQQEFLIRGGTNAKTGERSVLQMDTIIAVDSSISPTKYRHTAPALNNRELFARDHKLCAYCGNVFRVGTLTRDHVLPRSKGGSDCWENVVTACKACNQRKDDRTPEQAGMLLKYIPYIPSYNESLILKNHRILDDQMEYLIKGVSKESRLHAILAA